MRLAVALLVALPLAAADLAVKATWPTPWWAYHQRSLGWIVLCLVVLAGIGLLVRLPSLLVPPAAGILAGGVLGNVLSAAWNGLVVPNPLVLTGSGSAIAFNLADVWVIVGLLTLVPLLGTWLIRHRETLPSRARARRRTPGS
jgi:lipoprotein signal peptidase